MERIEWSVGCSDRQNSNRPRGSSCCVPNCDRTTKGPNSIERTPSGTGTSSKGIECVSKVQFQKDVFTWHVGYEVPDSMNRRFKAAH